MTSAIQSNETDVDDSQKEVVEFLLCPETHGSGADRVQHIVTHISDVFLAGKRAYKLKRSVTFPYLDFSTLELRLQACQAEIRINRRTAPDIYLGVIPVTRESSGELCLNGTGTVVDWLVKMLRFDDQTLFSRLAERGTLDDAIIEKLAESIATFHKASARIEGHREPGRTRSTVDMNRACFQGGGGDLISPDEAQRLTEHAVRFLEKGTELLKRRESEGRVRHCHGDLHLGNICLFNEQPTLFDAIEFNTEFAEIDVFYDLAFLLMDLDYWSLRPLANSVLNRYLDLTGDVQGVALLPLFLSLRAAVRSHVRLAQMSSQADDEPKLAEEAKMYFRMALDYLDPSRPRLIAVGGLSGSGKSCLARALAPTFGAAPGARVVRTDALRKRLGGVGLYEQLPPEAYTKALSEETYKAVFAEAREVLEGGHSVICDGVFARADERHDIEEVAAELGVPFQGVWLDAPEQTLIQRVNNRTHDFSDATADVVCKQLNYETGLINWHRIDASAGPDTTFSLAHQALQIDV